MRYFKVLIIVGCCVSFTPLRADPPKLDYIYPAGIERGGAAQVTASGAFKKWPVKIWCSDPGVKIQSAKKRGKLSVTCDANTSPGVYWMRLYNEDGASSLRPLIIGALAEVAEVEPNNQPLKSQYIKTSAVTVNGRLQSAGDVDVFAVDLRKGQTLVASMTAHQTLKSPMDGILQVLSPEGFVLQQNDDFHGKDPQIIFRVPKDGRYAIRTFAFPETPTSSIRFAGAATYIYRLTLTTGPFADHAYPLAVEQLHPSKVEIVGWNIPIAAKSVTVIPTDDAGIVYHPLLANSLALSVEPHPSVIETKKTNRATSQRVKLPVTVTGHLSGAGETDHYEFVLKKGQRLQIGIDASELGSPLDPVLRFVSPTGKILKTAQSRKIGADPSLTVAAPADGNYRVEVNDLHSRGGLRYVYRLRLARPTPDFSLSVAKDRYAFRPGQSIDIPVSIKRQNGFKEKIEINALGLPAGVTASPIIADVKKKSVKVRLTGKGAGVSGMFRIAGQVNGKQSARQARAPVAEVNHATSYLWVTMSKTVKSTKTAKKK